MLLILSLAVGIWAASIGFNYERLDELFDLQLRDPLINNYIVIGLWLGVIFVGCSREKIEDKMIARIRLNALLAAFYIQAAFIIVATFVCNNLDYLTIMIYNLVTYPLLFVTAYRVMLWRARKGADDVE